MHGVPLLLHGAFISEQTGGRRQPACKGDETFHLVYILRVQAKTRGLMSELLCNVAAAEDLPFKGSSLRTSR